VTSQQHPGADQLSAYLDGSLAETERTRIDAHLARCDDCREDVVEVVRLFRSPARRRVWYVGTGLAAAVLAGVLLFAPPLGRESGPAGPLLRGPEKALPEENIPSLRIFQPRDGSTIATDGVSFSWRPVGHGASYRLTVTDDIGDVVWTASSADTELSLPSDSALSPDKTYLWYVDALLPDGRSITSGVHEFKTSR
jgi:hypothetical protein